jgi:hypothetical protein
VVVLGSTLPALLGAGPGDGDGEERRGPVDFVGLYEDQAKFRAESGFLEPDLAVLEWPTIHRDHLPVIVELVARARVPRAVIVYHYASRDVVDRLEAQHIVPKRAPADVQELKRWCLALHAAGAGPVDAGEILSYLDPGTRIPAPRYDSGALARIASASSTVRCECPRHLVELVTMLIAFERYSQECENRNLDDAALHAYLHAATAQARATMEAALERVVEAEGIDL